MLKLTTTALVALLVLGGVAPAAQITGLINFDGSNTYSTTTHSVTFIGSQNAESDTGDLAAFGTCTGCLTFQDFTYVPFAPVLNEVTGTNNGVTLSLDVASVSSVTEDPTFLDIAGTAVLHLTGFDATPGQFFFSTQGPQGPEVSFSTTALAVPEPATIGLLGLGLLGLGLVRRQRT